MARQPTLRAYQPTPRDMLATRLLGLAGENPSYGLRRFIGNLVGSAGAGHTGRNSLIDWTPFGVPLQLHEGGQKLGTPGQRVQGGLEIGLAAVPVPAAAKGIARLAGKKAEKEAVKGITAYHGSPHQFDRFDMSKIGTGEGAQAYGHGLYFAENEATAKAYRDALKWKGTDWHDPESVASFWVQNRGGVDGAKKMLEAAALSARRNPANHSDLAANKAVEDALALLNSGYAGEKGSANPGHMYQVRINADPAHFLDWDAPITQQHPKVQAAADKILDPGWRDWNPVGESLIGPHRGEEGARRAALMQEAGVPGIRYLDQGSRGNVDVNALRGTVGMWETAVRKSPGDTYAKQMLDQSKAKLAEAEKLGTRNLVVFNEKIIDIMKRYGVAAPVAATMLSMGFDPSRNTGQ